MKKIFFFASALVALASCTSDEYLGGGDFNNPSNDGSIQFTAANSKMSRADKTGADAATLLNNNFVVFGNKLASGNTQTVFDNYQVNYKTNTANTTESNTANWEYVGYQTKQTTPVDQSIKYWDFSANPYSFFAYSKGTGSAIVSVLDGGSSTAKNQGTYTIQGTAANLEKVYITDHFQVVPNVSSTQVTFPFKALTAKARIGVYETIPGYSISDIKFYSNASTGNVANGTLYTSSTLANGGTYTVTFDVAGKAKLAYANSGTGAGTKTSQDFGTFTLDADADYKEATAKYLGRSSEHATKTEYVNVLPNPAGTAMTLKVDYTLTSLDGSAETIKVTGATATVPAAYVQWQPNYAYTYLFKISDNTNGTIGTATGLYPITLDAIVTDASTADQETITTVAAHSVTTYAKGTNVTANNEYPAGDVYVVVDNGTALTVSTNAFLYTATIEAGAAQGITEATVENAIQHGGEASPYTVTDAAGKALTVTDAIGLTTVTSIPTDATVDGIAKTVNCAKFTVVAGKTYVFAYLATAGSATSEASNSYSSTATYYKKNAAGYYYEVSIADASAFGSEKANLYTSPTQPVYAYKVIKAVAAVSPSNRR